MEHIALLLPEGRGWDGGECGLEPERFFYRDESHRRQLAQGSCAHSFVYFAPDFRPPFGLSSFVSQARGAMAAKGGRAVAVAVSYAKNHGQPLLEWDPSSFTVSFYRPRSSSHYHDGLVPLGVFFWERGYEGDRGRPPSSFLVGAQAIPTSVARKGLIWEKRRPALFLDRDGIINVDRGYIHLPRDITLYEEACDLIRFAKERGWWVFVLTNQSGVARGKFTCQQLEALHRHLGELLAQREAPVDDWFYCPFLPPFSKASVLRKPGPGMVLQACQKYSIDLEKSFMIGDKLSDELEIPILQGAHIQRARDLKGAKWPIFSNYGQLLKYLKKWEGA